MAAHGATGCAGCGGADDFVFLIGQSRKTTAAAGWGLALASEGRLGQHGAIRPAEAHHRREDSNDAGEQQEHRQEGRHADARLAQLPDNRKHHSQHGGPRTVARVRSHAREVAEHAVELLEQILLPLPVSEALRGGRDH
eukprot:5384413-Prymnesium_polylepis.1